MSLKSSDTKTPQGDEYRFFLRVEGYDVEEVSDYARADKLIIFVEDENIDWENWNSWETDVFGKKNEPDILQTDGILILIYSK